MYLTHRRPDILFSTCMISRFMHFPSSHYLGATKRILKYIYGTLDLRIHYNKVQNFNVVGYSNGDWAGSCDDNKITSGYVF